MVGSSVKDQNEKDLEDLAKALLSTPPKPREESKGGKNKKAAQQAKVAQRKDSDG